MPQIFDPEKVKRFALNLAGICIGTWLFFKAFAYIAPFVIAVLLAFALDPIISFWQKRKIPRKIATILTLLLFLGVFIFLVAFILIKLFTQLREFFEVVPGLFNDFYQTVIALLSEDSTFLSNLPEELAVFIRDFLENIVSVAGNLINDIVKGALGLAISIPSAILFITMTLISTYFIASDKEKIRNFLNTQIPAYWIRKFQDIKGNIKYSILRLIRAYLIIMSITFTELMIGFTIIKVNYSFALAAIIAVVDILPVLGTGIFIFPWTIYSYITGDVTRAFSLLILYGIIQFVRQLIEPKIVGTQIGVHPVLTLGSMYVGIKVLGGVGIILGPIIFMVLRSISQVVFRGQTLKELLLYEQWIKK